MRWSTKLGLLMLSCTMPACSQINLANSTEAPDVIETARPLAARVESGRVEGCAVNPPLTLFSRDVRTTQKDGNYLLKLDSTRKGAVTISAVVGGAQGEARPVILDALSFSPDGAHSLTGEAWKVLADISPAASLSTVQLATKRMDFSVCEESNAVLVAGDVQWTNSAALAAAAGIGTYTASSHPLDILGLNSNSYVRLRLHSVPSEADILLGGIRQPPRTDTILDVVAAVIPRIRIQKVGYEPCLLNQHNLKFEGQSRRVLIANCELIPKGGKKKNER